MTKIWWHVTTPERTSYGFASIDGKVVDCPYGFYWNGKSLQEIKPCFTKGTLVAKVGEIIL